MPRSAPLWEQIIKTVQLRLLCFDVGIQMCAAARTVPRIGLFRLQDMICLEPEIGLVLILDLTDYTLCRHGMNPGSPSKRTLQSGLHTQQFVMLWQMIRA
jgi:hypothetical protein